MTRTSRSAKACSGHHITFAHHRPGGRYRRLKNFVILVTGVAYFAATFLGQRVTLRILCEKLLIISQRLYGVPPFRFYALTDGIRRILCRGSFSPPPTPPAGMQLELTLGWEG